MKAASDSGEAQAETFLAKGGPTCSARRTTSSASCCSPAHSSSPAKAHGTLNVDQFAAGGGIA